MSLIGAGYGWIGIGTCGVHISFADASLYRRCLPSLPGTAPRPSCSCIQRAKSWALHDRPPAGAPTLPEPSRSGSTCCSLQAAQARIRRACGCTRLVVAKRSFSSLTAVFMPIGAKMRSRTKLSHGCPLTRVTSSPATTYRMLS